MCSPPILIFLFLSFTHLPSPPLFHSARRPSPFIPSPPSHSPSPPLSPPLPSLPSGGEIHARPAGRRGSSTAGLRGSSVRDIHARELDHGHRGSSTAAGARAIPRRPFPFPLCSFPLLAPTLAPLRPFPLLRLALLPYRSAAAAGTASSRRAWRRRERRRRERRDSARCSANRPL